MHEVGRNLGMQGAQPYVNNPKLEDLIKSGLLKMSKALEEAEDECRRLLGVESTEPRGNVI